MHRNLPVVFVFETATVAWKMKILQKIPGSASIAQWLTKYMLQQTLVEFWTQESYQKTVFSPEDRAKNILKVFINNHRILIHNSHHKSQVCLSVVKDYNTDTVICDIARFHALFFWPGVLKIWLEIRKCRTLTEMRRSAERVPGHEWNTLDKRNIHAELFPSP